MAEKKYYFVKRLGPYVYYANKDKAIEAEEGVNRAPDIESNKAFLMEQVEGYATPYPPATSGGGAAASAPPPPATSGGTASAPPPPLPLPDAATPYTFEIALVTSEVGSKFITAKIIYKGQLIDTVKKVADYTYIIEGKEYKGIVAVRKELKVLSETAGFFVNNIAFPAAPPPEEVDPAVVAAEEARKKIDALEKMGEALLDAAIAAIPKEDMIIEMLAEKEPAIASVIKMIRQEQKENEKAGMSKEEAKKKADDEIKKMIKVYKKAIKDFVKAELKKMKDNLTVFVKAVKAIPIDVANAITAIALPPGITVPPGAPNPAYALLLAKQIKNALGVTLSSAVVAFGIVMAASLLLKIELPAPFVATYKVMLTLSTVIDGIPV